MVGQVGGSGWWLHRAQLDLSQLTAPRCVGAGGREQEHTSARCRPLSTMADIYDRAEELNQVSALYNVEIDGVPLQQMSTNELAKVRCAPYAPLDIAVELAHFARDASPGDASSLTITAPAPAVPFRFRSLRRVVYP